MPSVPRAQRFETALFEDGGWEEESWEEAGVETAAPPCGNGRGRDFPASPRSKRLEGEPVEELFTPTPRDPRPALEPPSSSSSIGPSTTSGSLALAALPESLRNHLKSGRQLARESRRARRDAPDPQPTALPEVDRLLAGGLPRGGLVEVVGPRSSGRFSLVLASLAAATGSGDSAALVDLGDHLDPHLAAVAGVDLERLLWLRPRRCREALAGAEILLTTGFPLVVVDLGQPPVPGGRGIEAAWLRLVREAQRRQASLLVSSPYRVSGTAATVVLAARGHASAWTGSGRSPRLLLGLDPRLHLEKGRLPAASLDSGRSGSERSGAETSCRLHLRVSGELTRSGHHLTQVPPAPSEAPPEHRPDRLPKRWTAPLPGSHPEESLPLRAVGAG